MTQEQEDQRTPKEIAANILKLFQYDLDNPGMVFDANCNTLTKLGKLCETELGDRDIILKARYLANGLKDLTKESQSAPPQELFGMPLGDNTYSKDVITENALPVLAALRYHEEHKITKLRNENINPEDSTARRFTRIIRQETGERKKNRKREDAELDETTRAYNSELIGVSQNVLKTYDDIEKEFRALANKLGIELNEPDGPTEGHGGGYGGRG